MRDNMNYQEYAWPFPSKISTNASNDSSDPWNTNIDFNIGTCVGNACCDEGLIYDNLIDKCILGTKTNQTDENAENAFINNILTKRQPGKFKNDHSLREPNAFNM